MAAAACFGVRRLSPLRGVLQVVRTEVARAFSGDGVTWEVQVLVPWPEHGWHSPNQHQPVLRFCRFGVWSAATGLGRVPVSPIMDLDAMWAGANALLAQLPDCLERLPFPAGDPLELWLLDPAGEPFCLAATATADAQLVEVRPPPWVATALTEHGFVSATLSALGVPRRQGPDPRHHAAELERLVRTRGGSPPRRQWFRRLPGGRGVPVGDEVAGADRPLPGLPLAVAWPEPRDQGLVGDYLDWCAPYLLTWPDLDDPARARLEQAAGSQARAVAALYRLYPRILDPDLIQRLRVEARLRDSHA
jgi:hypothetical protein